MIRDNTFAAACFEQNSIEELETALRGDADATDCKTWGITPQEWRAQIAEALAAKRENLTADD